MGPFGQVLAVLCRVLPRVVRHIFLVCATAISDRLGKLRFLKVVSLVACYEAVLSVRLDVRPATRPLVCVWVSPTW